MFSRLTALVALSLFAAASAQQVGSFEAETHPKLSTQKCTSSGCTTQSTSVVLDANWRWLHSGSSGNLGPNCYTGNTWDTSICSSPSTCASQCSLEGAKYSETYGITTSGSSLTLKFITGKNIGSRVYLMDTETTYAKIKLLNQEFTFDVDMSNLGCGLNGALYFIEMDQDGGMAKFPTNKAGAKYGTGYCDAQCPHDLKFINGEANTIGWTGADNDINSGSGQYGTCCSEMDIWEANFAASAYTPHPCSATGATRCSGTECGDADDRYAGICDKDGCDFNSYRLGDKTFLGQGKTVDTNKKITVVTQFITDSGTASGSLSEIRRLYVQNGVVIQNSNTNVNGITATKSITDNFCSEGKTVFGDNNDFARKGGLKKMGAALGNGMVLALSVWDDHAANMLWLDSNYPTDKNENVPGVARGPCATTSGVPSEVEQNQANSSVVFSNIKWGDIGSTYSTTGGTPGTPSSTSAPPPSSTGAPQWAQCGGTNWQGSTTCVSPYTCHVLNPFYSQCY